MEMLFFFLITLTLAQSESETTRFRSQQAPIEQSYEDNEVKITAAFLEEQGLVSIEPGKVNITDCKHHLPERDRIQIEAEFPWIAKPAWHINISEIMKDGRPRLGGPNAIPKSIGLSHQNILEVTGGFPIANKNYKVIMKQMWNGIQVYNSKVTAQQESTGFILADTISGQFLKNIEVEITKRAPNFDNVTALGVAKMYNKDFASVVENVDVQLQIVQVKSKIRLAYIVDYFTSGNLYKYHPKSVGSGELKYVNLEQLQQMFSKVQKTDARRPITILDAHSAEVYRSWNGLSHALASTPLIMGNPISGVLTVSQMLDKTETLCTYTFPLSASTFITTNDRNDAAVSKKTEFVCANAANNSYDKTNEAQSPRNAAFKWAIHAHSYMKIISSFIYKQNIPIEVHHDGMTAMWTGSKMIFGDGNPVFYPMTEPDIIAHEMFHLFTDVQSNLEYRGQSGAIAEAYSDMAGVAFLNHVKKPNDFTIGTLVSKLKIPLRDLCNPSSNTTISYNAREPAIDHISQWKDTMGVHRAMGIYTKAFCLLARSPDWNVQTAFKVFTDANMFSWTPETSFSLGACGVRKAAFDLRGAAAQTDVDKAFAAVGIVCSA